MHELEAENLTEKGGHLFVRLTTLSDTCLMMFFGGSMIVLGSPALTAVDAKHEGLKKRP